MDTLGDYAMLVGFDQQLDYVEQMLQKADKYNIRLVTQIDNLKNLVQANQNILHNLQSNEAHMKALLEDNQKAELHAKMISCAKRLKRKMSLRPRIAPLTVRRIRVPSRACHSK
ncbi:PREDICTED: uncharacterized protein LOC108610542 isoform X2 [Drosophila arizonae]|uniref:Uncharacterized protein LOC108610542 isoform X2 n=1 Tax=Drosophila arizonae TaxID=7263 RepID=A0ABM1NTB5_DROAR|nr:PREDICTED: uncharacterized protein LOC108610542 isoform X2 [Drosophila arizonae]